MMHDSPGELAQPFGVQDWKKGEIDLIPRQNRAQYGRG
jgi:nitrate reductase alpha subunit